ncbi:MAG: DUF2188 domain-containing protein [Syntrophorhabdaceae bacterium]
MDEPGSRIVYRENDGTWVNKAQDAGRASSSHETLLKAMDAARKMLRNEGGGQLTIKGEDGSIKDVSTVPGNIPGSGKSYP